MLIHKKISRRIFLEQRLVFDGPDAAKAESWSKEALPQAVDSMKESGDVLKAALAWIDAQTVKDMDPADLKKTQDMAKEKLRANAAELQKAREFITAKTTCAAQAEALKVQDFWQITAAVKKIKDLGPALEYRPDDATTKSYKSVIESYKTTAKNYYDALKGPGETKIDSIAAAQAYLVQIGMMEKAKMEGYPGLDDKTEVEERLKKESAAIFAALDSAGDEIKGEPEIKRQLEMLKFASTNYDAAVKEEGNEGHLAGAKEYLDMVAAEQQARQVWGGLTLTENVGSSWRTGSIDSADSKLADNAWKRKELIKLYNDGVDSFQTGKGLADKAKGSGKPGEATAKFREAIKNWTQLWTLQQEEAAAAKQAENDAVTKETEALKTAMDNYNKALDTFNTGTYNKIINSSKIVQDHVTQYLGKDLTAAKGLADKGDYDEATKAINALGGKLDGDLKAYQDILSRGKKEIGRAITQMQGGGAYQDSTKQQIIGDYLNNSGAWNGVPAWLKAKRGDIKVSGQWVYDSADSKQLYKLSGNLYGVTVTDTGTEGNNYETANSYGTSRVTVEAPQGFMKMIKIDDYKHKEPVKKKEAAKGDKAAPAS
jgi:hypothetical protein